MGEDVFAPQRFRQPRQRVRRRHRKEPVDFAEWPRLVATARRADACPPAATAVKRQGGIIVLVTLISHPYTAASLREQVRHPLAAYISVPFER
jgi:hypothetical protein